MKIINEIFAAVLETKNGDEYLISTSVTQEVEQIKSAMINDDCIALAKRAEAMGKGRIKFFRFFLREEFKLD